MVVLWLCFLLVLVESSFFLNLDSSLASLDSLDDHAAFLQSSLENAQSDIDLQVEKQLDRFKKSDMQGLKESLSHVKEESLKKFELKRAKEGNSTDFKYQELKKEVFLRLDKLASASNLAIADAIVSNEHELNDLRKKLQDRLRLMEAEFNEKVAKIKSSIDFSDNETEKDTLQRNLNALVSSSKIARNLEIENAAKLMRDFRSKKEKEVKSLRKKFDDEFSSAKTAAMMDLLAISNPSVTSLDDIRRSYVLSDAGTKSWFLTRAHNNAERKISQIASRFGNSIGGFNIIYENFLPQPQNFVLANSNYLSSMLSKVSDAIKSNSSADLNISIKNLNKYAKPVQKVVKSPNGLKFHISYVDDAKNGLERLVGLSKDPATIKKIQSEVSKLGKLQGNYSKEVLNLKNNIIAAIKNVKVFNADSQQKVITSFDNISKDIAARKSIIDATAPTSAFSANVLKTVEDSSLLPPQNLLEIEMIATVLEPISVDVTTTVITGQFVGDVTVNSNVELYELSSISALGCCKFGSRVDPLIGDKSFLGSVPKLVHPTDSTDSSKSSKLVLTDVVQSKNSIISRLAFDDVAIDVQVLIPEKLNYINLPQNAASSVILDMQLVAPVAVESVRSGSNKCLVFLRSGESFTKPIVDGATSMTFSVKAGESVKVSFSNRKFSDSVFEITLNNNGKSYLKLNRESDESRVRLRNNDIFLGSVFSGAEFSTFWVSWGGRKVVVGKGHIVGEHAFLSAPRKSWKSPLSHAMLVSSPLETASVWNICNAEIKQDENSNPDGPQDSWRKEPRYHIFDSVGCFDFNFVAYDVHIFGFVSKSGIRANDNSDYDFYFVEQGIHFFGYEESTREGDKIGASLDDALSEDNRPTVQEILAERFDISVDSDFKGGPCFDYNFIQGGFNCFGLFEVGESINYVKEQTYDYDFTDEVGDHFFGYYCPDAKPSFSFVKA